MKLESECGTSSATAGGHPVVISSPVHTQQLRHPRDGARVLFRVHHEAVLPVGLDAKKDAARGKKSLSIRSCWFSTRSRSSSARSDSDNTSVCGIAALSLATHRPNNCSPTLISREQTPQSGLISAWRPTWLRHSPLRKKFIEQLFSCGKRDPLRTHWVDST